MNIEEKNKSLKADLFLAIELFNDLIATGTLGDLSERICIQLRELSGAKTVMLIKHDEQLGRHSLSGISPQRRSEEFSESELALLCPLESRDDIIVSADKISNEKVQALFVRLGIKSLVRFPLQIERKIIGLIVLLDLPEIERASEIIEILYFLATSMALTVRNALDREVINAQSEKLKMLNEGLEEKVKERTRELEEVNLKLTAEFEGRKKAQEELQESEQKYRLLFEASAEGILMVKPDTMQVVYANPAVCEMFGLDSHGLCKLMVTDLHPEESYEFIKKEFLSLMEGKKFYTASIPCRRKDGSLFFADIKASNVNFKGEPHAVGFFTDVTRRNKQEENLQRAAKLESLGVLAGGIAHDFNNLLGGIYGFIELSLDSVYEASALRNLSTALSTIDRAKALTRQLLTFSKGGAPEKRAENLFPFVKESVLFGLSGSKLTSSFEIDDDLWPCNIDRNQISQVVDNIVINARQAMENGGHLSIVAGNVELEGVAAHEVLDSGRYVRLTINDDGPGIEADKLKKIFDPFFTTKEMGNGLGLAVCYSIMRKHGGLIEAESAPGKGSTFSLLLPAAESQPKQAIRRDKIMPIDTGTILIMDDEEVVRNILSLMLKNLGFKSIIAVKGEEVLEKINGDKALLEQLRVMIFDLTVPGGMGGKELVERLREFKCKVPLIVTSGYAEDPVMANPQRFGFAASIKKPFRMAELLAVLASVLGCTIKSD